MAETEQKKVDLWANQSELAQGVLQYVLTEVDPETQARRNQEVAIDEAKRAEYILDLDTGRSKSRVLFLTSDPTILEAGSAVQNHYLGLASVFDECHVIVGLPQRSETTVARLAANVWVYKTGAISWWHRAIALYEMAVSHLTFNGTVRPDIIIATDGGACATAARMVSKKFDRRYQVHFSESAYRRWREMSVFSLAYWMGRVAVRHAAAVRVATGDALAVLQRVCGSRMDVAVLPVFHNFSQFKTSREQFTLAEKYPQYTFFALTEAPLSADSSLHDTISALRSVLLNPRIALVVLGHGQALDLFTEKVKLLGIERNVIFLKDASDVISLYRTADVLIETGTSRASDEHVLQATMAGLPMIMYETDVRRNLFTDGESAFLCPPGDVTCLTQKFNLFLNRSALRTQFAHNTKQVAIDRLKESPDAYYRALRDSIEVSVLPTQDGEAKLETPQFAAPVDASQTAGDVPAAQSL